MPLILPVHLREIPHVRQEHRHLDHFPQRRPRRGEDGGEVGDAEGGLVGDAAGGEGARGEGGQLAGEVDGAWGADCLGLL